MKTLNIKLNFLPDLLVYKFTFCFLLFCGLHVVSLAATRTSTASGGNWNSTSTWSTGVIPLAGDNVIIATTGANAVIVDGARTCVNLTINSRGRLTISGSNTLNVTGTINMPRPASGFTSELNVNAGTLNVAGLFTMSATSGTRYTILNITSGTANIADFTGSGAASRIVFDGSGQLNVSGVVTTNLTLVAGLGSVNFTGDVAQSVWPETYYNLGISGAGIKTLANATTVDNIATIDGTLDLATRRLNLTGSGTPLVVNNQLVSSTGQIDYAGDGAQIISDIDYYNLTLSGAGVKTFPDGSSVLIGRDLNVESTTLIVGNSSVDITRDITGAGTLEMENGLLTIGRSNTRTGAFIAGTGTVNYSRNNAQTIRAVEYYNLTLSLSGTKTIPADTSVIINNNLEVNGPLSVPGTASLDIKGDLIGIGDIILEAGIISLEGDWMNEGNLESGTSTIVFDGSGDQIVAGNVYYNLETGEGGVKSLSDDVIINNILKVGELSELDLLGYNLTLTGPGLTLINNGTFTPSTSTVYYTNAAEAEIAPVNYHNLDCSGGPRKLSETGIIGVSGLFSPGLGLFTVINSTVSFNGDDDQVLPQFTFHDVILAGSGEKLIDSTVNVKTMTIENGPILNLNSSGGGELVVTN